MDVVDALDGLPAIIGGMRLSFFISKTCNYSNISLNIKSENCLNIQFLSEFRRVNPNLRIRPFYFLKVAFSGFGFLYSAGLQLMMQPTGR
jgi:hypothetical protein